MLLSTVSSSLLLMAASVMPVVAVLESVPPDVQATLSFPEDNPFHHVVNGNRNLVNIAVENFSSENITIANVAASMHHPSTGALIKNLTALNYGVPLLEKAKITLPYAFHSEFRTGDMSLKVWIEYIATEKHRVVAYDSIVAVVEPPASWLDFQMFTTYIIFGGIVGGLGWFGYSTYFGGKSKKRPATRKARTNPAAVDAVSTAVDTPLVPGSGSYSEEWIPEHHLKTRRKKTGDVALSSGDEKSGADSGVEKRRTRRK